MHTEHQDLSTQDKELLDSTLDLLGRAGVQLAPQVEVDDVEDAVADDLASFRAYPLTTVAGLGDPHGEALFSGAVVASGSAEPQELVECYASAVGADLRDVAVVQDPGSSGKTGSVRIRFGEWDVADVDFDLGSEEATRTFELDVIAAALPLDAAAATFPTPAGEDVTLFIPAGAPSQAVDDLFAAIEAEFGA